jgi:hypothetical protein
MRCSEFRPGPGVRHERALLRAEGKDMGKDIGAAVGQAINDARWSYRAGYAPRRGASITNSGSCVRASECASRRNTGYYAWPEDRSSRMKGNESHGDTPFDAAEIGLRGAIEHTKGALGIRLRIEKSDIVTIPDDDHPNARLDLAVLT